MAFIENRFRFVVTVQNCEQLTRTFAYNREQDLKVYIAELKTAGYKPRLSCTNDSYAIRIRKAGYRNQCLYASSEQEAADIKQCLELERRSGLFVDYAKGHSVTFGDLFAHYLREISPRHKGFEVEGYIVNAILADAGLSRVDVARAYADHKNPHPGLAGKTFHKPSGKKVREPSPLHASSANRSRTWCQTTSMITSTTAANQQRRQLSTEKSNCSRRHVAWLSTPGVFQLR